MHILSSPLNSGAAVPSTVATRSRSQDDAVLIKPLEGSEQQMETNISSAKWSCAHVEAISTETTLV